MIVAHIALSYVGFALACVTCICLAVTWHGLLMPATPSRHLLKRLHAAVICSLGGKDVQDRLQALGAKAATNAPGQFAAMIKEEISKWAKVVRSANIKPR